MSIRFAPSLARRVTALACVALLCACTQMEKEIGQCEPGVADLSAMATIAPTKC